MRDQLQEVLVGGLLHEGEARHEECAAAPVLEPAASLVVEMDEEEVAVVERQAPENGGERIDDLRHVGNSAPLVEIAAAPDDELVLDALRREGVDGV